VIGLSSIRQLDGSRYAVELLNDGTPRTFVFRIVVHREIEVVTSEESFSEMVVSGKWAFAPLFEAILAFHRARSIGDAR